MNRTKIEWAHYTWNPITGCLHDCPYCYGKTLAFRFPKIFHHRFEPHFYPERLEEPLKVKKPSRIFTVSMGDLFGEWVPLEWIHAVFDAMAAAPWHRFLILTKNPGRIERALYGQSGEWYLGGGDYHGHIWLGTTVDLPGAETRIDALRSQDLEPWHKFVSFEPLLGHVKPDLKGIEWVIIGAQTNPDRQPDFSWVEHLVQQAQVYSIPVFLKNNLRMPTQMIPWYPKELKV
jgi:protein gp37